MYIYREGAEGSESLQNVTVDYELGPEMYPTEVKKGVLLKNGELKLQGTMKTPDSCVAK